MSKQLTRFDDLLKREKSSKSRRAGIAAVSFQCALVNRFSRFFHYSLKKSRLLGKPTKGRNSVPVLGNSIYNK